MTHSSNEPVSRHGNPLTILACAVFLLIAIRAWHQSITIDEADTALYFALPDWPAHWHPASNNHILNTIGIRFFTTLFGLSAFTVRLPALLGAAMFLWAMHELVRSATASHKLRALLFAFATTNPLVLDHLVAARGYSLALGFLALAVSWLLRHPENGRITIYCCLAFLANFSFAFAAASVVAASLLLQLRHKGWPGLAVRTASSGVLLISAVASYTLLNWPKGEFVHGARSWQETLTALASASSYAPNHFILNPHLFVVFEKLTPVAFSILPVVMVVLLLVDLALPPSSASQRIIFGVTIAALAAHAILHWQTNTLLPKDRTALWILLFLQILAILLASRPSAAVAQSIIGVWLICQLACLRLDHFKEWKFDANSEQLFEAFECVAPHLPQDLTASRIYSQWPVVSAFNFYRTSRQRWTYPVLAVEYDITAPPPGRDVYFLQIDNSQDFIQREGLTVVYHDKVSEQGLAVRLPLKALQNSTCPASLTDRVKEWRKTLTANGTFHKLSAP